MKEKNKKLIDEIFTILIASLFLGFMLALTLKWPILSFEPADFFLMSALSLLICCVFVGAQKFAAYRLDCETRTNMLGFKRYWFGPTRISSGELPFKFPLWIVLPLLFFFITRGFFKWLAILDFDIEPKPGRVGRKWYALEESDTAKIAMAGPVALIVLAAISKSIGLASGIQNFTSFAIICSLFALLSLIPFGIGFKLLSSSRFIWIFLFVFSAVFLAMMKVQSLALIIAAALVFAFITLIGYYLLEQQ
jgi:hypothetical protein